MKSRDIQASRKHYQLSRHFFHSRIRNLHGHVVEGFGDARDFEGLRVHQQAHGVDDLRQRVRVVLGIAFQASRRDALLYAAGANGAHGLRRTNADKRRAVLLVLAACPKWSDRKIGEICGVDHKTVAAAREVGGEIPQGDDPSSAAGASPSADVDRLVAKLSKALTRVLKEWPAERRADLRKLLDAADAAVK